MDLCDDEDEGKGEAVFLLWIVVMDVVGRDHVVGQEVDPRHEQEKGGFVWLFGRASLGGSSGLASLDVYELLILVLFTAGLLQEFLGVGLDSVEAVRCGKGEEYEKDGGSHVVLANSILILIKHSFSLLVYTHTQYIRKILVLRMLKLGRKAKVYKIA